SLSLSFPLFPYTTLFRSPIKGVHEQSNPSAFYTKMEEASVGKDTMTGHWEIAGLRIEQPFQTFPQGFPHELIAELEKRTNRKVRSEEHTSELQSRFDLVC